MEDFVRELSSTSAFYLLYGCAGVGKTRLLNELRERRLIDQRVYWLDLAGEDAAGEDSLHEMIAAAEENAVIILDHFDRASNKRRHAVFREWTVDAVDRKLNFIVACRDEGFNDFRQLSQQYHVSVQSFQLSPFNEDEVEAFLAFYLFDNNPLASLSIAAPLRKQLKKTHGVVGNLIDLAAREKGSIQEAGHTSAASEQRKAAYLLAALIVCGALGLGLWFLGGWSGSKPPEVPATAATDKSAVTEAAAVSDAGVETSGQPEVAGQASVKPQAPSESTVVEQDAPQQNAGQSAASPVTDPVEQLAATVEVPEVADVVGTLGNGSLALPDEPSVQAASAPVTAAPVNPGDTDSAFAEAIQASMSWLESSEGSTGTIQIMSIGFDRLSTRGYFDYLESLGDKGVDVSQIRLFRTRAGDNEFYTIMYGQYADRRTAFQSIAGLPEALRANKPIPRTLAGILGEVVRSSR